MLDRVSDRVFADTSGNTGGNFGCVILDDQIVFIDAGMVHTHTAKVAEWVKDEFEKPITKLIYTHSHSDHVFGAQSLGDVSIIGSADMLKVCEGNMEDRWKHETILESMAPRKEEQPELWDAVQSLKICLPDILFEDKMTVGCSRDLSIIHRGGHTSGSSTVCIEPEHILFIGDLIFQGVFPYAGDPTCNPDRWIDVLEEIIVEDYETIIPGHGKRCDNNELRKHISFLSELRDVIKNALKDGITEEEFIDRGLIPDYYRDSSEYRGPITVKQFYNFYGTK